VGIKLELTHACNLRCDFCYTDSPRHTLARTADLDDGEWRRAAREAVELGVIEAVVTGGEPLLRAPLALELIESMASHGIAVTLNTNGWFVDEPLADRLAAVPGLTVSVSVDGATPELHDAARGVPGSWRRAVRAISLLLDRDVKLFVGHVVTPLNVRWVPLLLEHAWLLGARAVRLTPVVPIGAASRERGWEVDRHALRHDVKETCDRLGDDLNAVVQAGTADILAVRDGRAPAAMLVRPSGAVLIDSLHPFAFGHVDDGLAECWRRIVAGWRSPSIERWARGIRGTRQLATATVVPYVDGEPRVGRAPARHASTAASPPRLPPRAARSTQAAGSPGDVAAARRHLLALSRQRRYATAPLRWSGGPDGERVVRLLADGRVCRLNGTAGLLLDRLDGGTLGEAADALAARYPQVPSDRVVLDAIRTVRWLSARGVVRGAGRPVSA
jgi:MoaA/NifB/PqqE/SkfB family radical SAM enzyme